MIDIFKLYNDFQSYVNTFQGGWFRPQSDFQNACNNISNELWEVMTRGSEKSQEYRDNLVEFLKHMNIITKPEKGNYATAALPKDYGRFASMKYLRSNDKYLADQSIDGGKCFNGEDFVESEKATQEYYENLEEVGIDNIDNQRWPAMLRHETKAPTEEEPKCTQIDKGIRVAPRKISTVVLDYYVRPTDAVFGYTITPGNVETGAGDQIVYDASKSTQLQWPTTMVNEFLIRLGERYGVFTRDQFVAQFSTQQKM